VLTHEDLAVGNVSLGYKPASFSPDDPGGSSTAQERVGQRDGLTFAKKKFLYHLSRSRLRNATGEKRVTQNRVAGHPHPGNSFLKKLVPEWLALSRGWDSTNPDAPKTEGHVYQEHQHKRWTDYRHNFLREVKQKAKTGAPNCDLDSGKTQKTKAGEYKSHGRKPNAKPAGQTYRKQVRGGRRLNCGETFSRHSHADQTSKPIGEPKMNGGGTGKAVQSKSE